MKPQNTTTVSRIVASDLDAIIAGSPETFDVVLFRAVSSDKETVADGDDPVGSLESSERKIGYEPPVVVPALEPALEIMGYPMLSSGDGYGLQQDQGPYRLLIAGRVPKQSVVAFPVAQHDGTYTLRVMYVLSSETLGRKAPAGYVYTLIPYVGGGDQIEVVTPSLASIVDHVASLLESVAPPDAVDVPDVPQDPDTAGADEIGSL